MEFLSLPVVAIENIFAYISFDEIAKNRRVCKEMDAICQRMLNRGWSSIERRLQSNLKSVKSQLPRRESERRSHPMARHCDILSSIETRISMLNMTYAKYMDSHICCFIPGKIIDEISRILSIIQVNNSPPRAHEVLQELRDISSMAIEHFDDKVSPPMRSKLQMMTNSFVHQSQITENFPIPPTFESKRCCAHSRLSIKVVKRLELRLDFYRNIIAQQARSLKELESNQAEMNKSIAVLLASNVSGGLSQDISCAESQRIQEPTETSNKTELFDMAERFDMELAGPSVPLKNTRNFGSQIRLDPTEAAIGRKRNSQESNMKPRRASILLPMTSCFDDNQENYINPAKMRRFASLREPSVTLNVQTMPNKGYKMGRNIQKCDTSNDLRDRIKADMMMRDQRKSTLDMLLSSVLYGRMPNNVNQGQNPLMDMNLGQDEEMDENDDDLDNEIDDNMIEFGDLRENDDMNVQGGPVNDDVNGMNENMLNLHENGDNVNENVFVDLNRNNDNLNIQNDNLDAHNEDLNIHHDDQLNACNDNLNIRNDQLNACNDNLNIRNDQLNAHSDNLNIRNDQLNASNDNLNVNNNM